MNDCRDTLVVLRPSRPAVSGYSLIEMLEALAILSILLVIATVGVGAAIGALEARGAAQEWQAACAWAQLGVLWHGGSAEVTHNRQGLRVVQQAGDFGSEVVPALPRVTAAANLARWNQGGGVGVRFLGLFASPDGGGTVMFGRIGTGCRVVVRPESGVTRRVKP